jgi:hypothetical protein
LIWKWLGAKLKNWHFSSIENLATMDFQISIHDLILRGKISFKTFSFFCETLTYFYLKINAESERETIGYYYSEFQGFRS